MKINSIEDSCKIYTGYKQYDDIVAISISF